MCVSVILFKGFRTILKKKIIINRLGSFIPLYSSILESVYIAVETPGGVISAKMCQEVTRWGYILDANVLISFLIKLNCVGTH